MARAYGIAVIPNVVKVAAVVGGRRGSGAMVVRDANGKFTDPIMVSLTGGNVGWQIGVQSTDIVLVFTTARGIEGITDGKLTLGADASVAAGPGGPGRLGRARTRTSPPRCIRIRAIAGCSPASRSTAAFSPSTPSRTRASTASPRPPPTSSRGKVTTDVDAAQRFERAILASTAGREQRAPSASNAKHLTRHRHDSGAGTRIRAAPAGATAFPDGRRAARDRTAQVAETCGASSPRVFVQSVGMPPLPVGRRLLHNGRSYIWHGRDRGVLHARAVHRVPRR